MAVTPEQVADAMYEMVKEYQGRKKFKAADLTKAMIKQFGEEEVDKKLCKAAIRTLMDSGKCVYTYFGGSFIEIPHEEGRGRLVDHGPVPQLCLSAVLIHVWIE